MKRYLNENRSEDILSDPDFHENNDVLKAVSTDLYRRGLGNIEHYPSKPENDQKKQYSRSTPVFDTTTLYGLHKKYGSILCYICADEDEKTYVLHFMTKDTFKNWER